VGSWRLGVELRHEAAVDLEAVERQLPEVRERGLGDAEVVESDVNSHLAHLGESHDRSLERRERGPFTDLDLEQPWVKVVLRQRGLDGRSEVTALQSLRADVDSDPAWRALTLPALSLATGALEDPLEQGVTQLRLLEEREELGRLQQSPGRMHPPHQSLDALDRAAVH